MSTKAPDFEFPVTQDGEDEDCYDTFLLLPSKSGCIGVWYAPDTDKKMFVSKYVSRETGHPGWTIGHTPSVTGFVHVMLEHRPAAFRMAKVFYDAALAEHVAIASNERPDLDAWWTAIKKHDPSWPDLPGRERSVN
jgi:hypothetical protein